MPNDSTAIANPTDDTRFAHYDRETTADELALLAARFTDRLTFDQWGYAFDAATGETIDDIALDELLALATDADPTAVLAANYERHLRSSLARYTQADLYANHVEALAKHVTPMVDLHVTRIAEALEAAYLAGFAAARNSEG